MTRNGQIRTRMGDKSWKSGWATTISLLKYVGFVDFMVDIMLINTFRQPRLGLWSMSPNPKIPRDYASSIISSRT